MFRLLSLSSSRRLFFSLFFLCASSPPALSSQHIDVTAVRYTFGYLAAFLSSLLKRSVSCSYRRMRISPRFHLPSSLPSLVNTFPFCTRVLPSSEDFLLSQLIAAHFSSSLSPWQVTWPAMFEGLWDFSHSLIRFLAFTPPERFLSNSFLIGNRWGRDIYGKYFLTQHTYVGDIQMSCNISGKLLISLSFSTSILVNTFQRKYVTCCEICAFVLRIFENIIV